MVDLERIEKRQVRRDLQITDEMKLSEFEIVLDDYCMSTFVPFAMIMVSED